MTTKMEDIKLFNNQFIIPEGVKKGVLFLDRDGVIIKDVNYISKPSDVVLEKGVSELIKEAFKRSIYIVIITNQSGISRGYYDWKTYDLVTQRMLDLLGKNHSIIGIFANGYGPSDNDKDLRKPNPGMIYKASKILNIDLTKSYIIGDRLSDIQAGAKAKLKKLVHVNTGHGISERKLIKEKMEQNNFFLGKKSLGISTEFIENLSNLDKDFFMDLSKI